VHIEYTSVLSRHTRFTLYINDVNRKRTMKRYLNLFDSTGHASSFAPCIFGTFSLGTVLLRHGGYKMDASGGMRCRIIIVLHVMRCRTI
jgi:hypothetical protein